MVSPVNPGFMFQPPEESEIKSLTDRMKEATAQVHEEVTYCSFFEKLRKGEQEKTVYCHYLKDLHAMYSSMEQGLRTNSFLSSLYVPNLCRKEAIEKDFTEFKIESYEIGEAAKLYSEHLEWIGRERPYCLIAHAYTHYLGGLFGGQILARHVRELWGEQSANLYDFSDLIKEFNCRSTAQYAGTYKEELNRLALTSSEQASLVEEAETAFHLTKAMMKELEASNNL